MHECISLCVCVCARVCYVALTSLLLHVSLYPPCVCPSHPSRSFHLYLSETSIEIDSSDGMISEASTKDPSSSESEGPSSDEEEDDDSDWGGGDRQRMEWYEVSQRARRGAAQMAPRKFCCSAVRSWDDEHAAAVLKRKTGEQEQCPVWKIRRKNKEIRVTLLMKSSAQDHSEL